MLFQIKTFAATLVRSFTVSKEHAQFGVIVFSNDVQTIIQLNQYGTTDEMANAILSLSYTTGQTNTARLVLTIYRRLTMLQLCNYTLLLLDHFK